MPVDFQSLHQLEKKICLRSEIHLLIDFEISYTKIVSFYSASTGELSNYDHSVHNGNDTI